LACTVFNICTYIRRRINYIFGYPMYAFPYNIFMLFYQLIFAFLTYFVIDALHFRNTAHRTGYHNTVKQQKEKCKSLKYKKKKYKIQKYEKITNSGLRPILYQTGRQSLVTGVKNKNVYILRHSRPGLPQTVQLIDATFYFYSAKFLFLTVEQIGRIDSFLAFNCLASFFLHVIP